MSERSYATNLASEFHVMSALYRMGYNANLTLGNRKAVDIVVVLDEGRAVTIDVKAVAGRNGWMLGNRDPLDAPGHFVVLVSFEGAFADARRPPRVWVFPVAALRPFVSVADGRGLRYIHRKAILDGAADYENAWHLLRQPFPTL